MNKNIKELYQEAIQYTMENAGSRGQKSSDAMCADKFAELIIKKCALLATSEVAHYKEPQPTYKIYEHFGLL